MKLCWLIWLCPPCNTVLLPPDEVHWYPNHYVCHSYCTMQQEDTSLTSDHIWDPDDGDMSEAKWRDENVLGMVCTFHSVLLSAMLTSAMIYQVIQSPINVACSCPWACPSQKEKIAGLWTHFCKHSLSHVWMSLGGFYWTRTGIQTKGGRDVYNTDDCGLSQFHSLPQVCLDIFVLLMQITCTKSRDMFCIRKQLLSYLLSSFKSLRLSLL